MSPASFRRSNLVSWCKNLVGSYTGQALDHGPTTAACNAAFRFRFDSCGILDGAGKYYFDGGDLAMSYQDQYPGHYYW